MPSAFSLPCSAAWQCTRCARGHSRLHLTLYVLPRCNACRCAPVGARRFFRVTGRLLSCKDTRAPVTVGPSVSSYLLTGTALRLPPPHALCSAKMRSSFRGRTSYPCTAPAHTALLPTMDCAGRGSLRWHSGIHCSVASPGEDSGRPRARHCILASILTSGIMAKWHEKTKKMKESISENIVRRKGKCIFAVT